MEKMVTETKDELKAELERKTKEIGVNIDLEMGHVMARIEACDGAYRGHREEEDVWSEFDPDEGRYPGEDIQAKIEELLRTGIHSDVPVVAAERMKPRGRGPGVVKVRLRSVQEKVAVLRGKQKLKGNPLYEKVFLRTLLREIYPGERITSSPGVEGSRSGAPLTYQPTTTCRHNRENGTPSLYGRR
ncbi:hypothetical protein Bbelb_393850 [Branchiostoma belcheri]|nr:hypothetical protein Bbelb_393850 [Branchiostoma belcheri]